MSELIVNTKVTVEIETQTLPILETLQPLQEIKINKTPIYTLRAQKNYYQVLYRQRKKQAKLLEQKKINETQKHEKTK